MYWNLPIPNCMYHNVCFSCHSLLKISVYGFFIAIDCSKQNLHGIFQMHIRIFKVEKGSSIFVVFHMNKSLILRW